MNQFPTGIPEVDQEILLNLSLPDVIFACQLTRYTQTLYTDDSFWKVKVMHDFNSEVVLNKPISETYQSQYRRLYHTPLSMHAADDAVEENFLDTLIWLQYNQILPSWHEGRDIAAEKGNLKILKWLYQQGMVMDVNTANYAAAFGHLDILNWLTSLDPPVYPDSRGANATASRGFIFILEWLKDNRIYPSLAGLDNAALKGHPNTVKWIVQHLNIIPTAEIANSAAKNGHLEILNWLAQQRVFPDRRGVLGVIGNNHLKTLKWMAQQEFQFDEEYANEAVTFGQLEIIKWFATQNIFPSQSLVDLLIKFNTARHNKLDVFKLLFKYNIFPSSESIEYAANTNQSDIIALYLKIKLKSI
jgi:hypothetical protein